MKKKILALTMVAAIALSLASCNTAEEMANDVENGMNNLEESMDPDKDNSDQNNNNQNNADQGNNNQDNSAGNIQNASSPVTRYSENNVEFDVPENWQKNFMAQMDEHKAPDASLGSYSTINFYYTGSASPTKVMTIGRFPKDSWAALNEQTPEAAQKKLGESTDGKWIYSLSFEENASQDQAYMDIMTEARKLKDKIKITG